MFNKITQSLSLFFRVVPSAKHLHSSLLYLLLTLCAIAVGSTAHAITQGGTITTGNNLGKDKAATDHMSMTEMVKQVTQQSAAKHRIETLADGRARIPSPLQTIDAFAASEGITVVSTNKDKPGNFAIRATSLGRTNVQSTLIKPGQVSVETDLVRIVHPDISEELTTSAEGVRQDFVISTAPQGSGELALELAFPGAALRSSGNTINLTMSGGRELVYHRLYVTDSSGKVLPARFELLDSNSLRVVVADAGAAYPVRIDPTISDNNWVSIARPDTNGSIFALASDGTNLYAGGDFTAIGGVVANKIAKWNGSVWSALGSGISGYGTYGNVAALTWGGTNLYAGGHFNTAGGVTARNIAKWDGSAWSALGDGIYESNNIHALAWDGANLYAGGGIMITPADVDGVKTQVAKWNGSTWSALGSFTSAVYGFPSRINAFAMNGTSLYVGGQFDHVGSVVANNIAKWDGSAWSGVGGTNYAVHALLWNGSTLYAGGEFTTAGGVNADKVAKWNGSVWSALGSGMSGYGTVSTLAWYGSGLYAGGDFTTAGGVSANYIAKWDGFAWLGINGMTVGVGQLLTVGSNLYVEGDFTTVGGVSASKIAQWNGTWSALGSGIDKNNINALVWDGTNLYVGGLFSIAEGAIANNIAKWNGSTWSALGSGMDGQVYALASDGTNLYAGGNFHTAGGVSANYIAKWNGSAWSALGSGMSSRVYTLAWGGTNLYAGGDFNTAGGISTFYVAKWNGSAWSSLSGGLAGSVKALAWDGTNLYVGGDFAYYFDPNLTSANGIAKWNGSVWSAMGGGVSYVKAIAWDGANLYAGGNGVFKWNGSAWSSLGLSGANALAWDGSNLYAGGSFTTIGGVSTKRIARWNGSAWSALGSGMSGAVNALAFDGSNLYAAGDFLDAGGNAARVAYFDKNIPTVNFVSRGGSVIDGQSLAFNTTASMPTTPTKSGTDFVGWYADAGLTLPFNFDTPITSDTWIYARWSLEPPTSTTGSVSDITTTSATLAGTVTSNLSATTVTFQYGTTTGYGSSATAAQSPLAPSTTGSAVSAAITGLTCGSSYYYQVVATNSDGTAYSYNGTFATSECPDTTPPSDPTTIELLAPSAAGQLTLDWVKPSDTDFAHIHIYRSTVAGTLGTLIADNLTAIKYIDGLPPSPLASQTKYYYTVRSVDTSGNESSNTAQVSATTLDATPPAVPGNQSAVASTTTAAITLTWTKPADTDFSHVHIYRSTASGTIGPLVYDNITTTSKIDTGLENGTTYYYTVRAVDARGNETTNTAQTSATVTLADVTGPGAVSNVNITFPANGDKTTLTWTNPGSDFSLIRIYRSTTSGQKGTLIYQGTAATYTDSNSTPGSTYWYTLDALDGSGNISAYIAPPVTPLDTQIPGCITQLKAAPLADAKIKLSWLRSPSTDVNLFYDIYADNGTGTISATSTASTTHPVTEWTSATLVNGTTYQYALKVADGSGNTTNSCATIAATALSNPAAAGVSASIKAPLSGKKYTGNQLLVMAEQIAGSSSDLKEIEFQYYNGTTWEKITPAAATLNPDATPSYFIYWDVTGMTNGDYKIRAVASNTNSFADSAPGFTTVTLNKDTPDIIQNGGSSQETVNTVSGGTVATSNASITIPAGTFTTDATVTITSPDPATKAATVPTNYDNALSFHDITTTGTTNPDSTIAVELPYPDANNDLKLDTVPAISVLDLKVCRNVSGQTWSCLDSTVDTANKVVKANTTTLGLMALLVPPVTMTQTGYNMASIALTPSNSATSAVFGGYVLDYNPTTQAFFNPATIQPGHGYFIWGARTLKPTGTEITTATHTVAIKKGWNLIGNPYKMKLPVQSLTLNCGTPKSITQSELDGEVVGTFFYAINGAYELATTQNAADTIDPWKGYWILSDKDCNLIFTKP